MLKNVKLLPLEFEAEKYGFTILLPINKFPLFLISALFTVSQVE